MHTGGRHHETSDETRKKISISLKNSIIFQQALQSEERRKKISESRKGKKRPPFSEEWKLKLGDASRGKKHTAESKRKIGEAHKGMRHSKESIKKMSQTKIRVGCHKGEKNYSFGRFGKDSAVARAVRNVTLNKIFGSAREASRFCGRNESSSIIKCCKGKKKRAYGYEWEYAND